MEDSLSQGVRSVPGPQPDEAVAPSLGVLGTDPEPAQAGPEPSGPQSAGPQLAGPQLADSPVAGPQVGGPEPAGPRFTGPQVAGSPPFGSQPAGPRLADRSFHRDEITVVRHDISDRLAAAGLTGDRLQGFVLAVNEVVTNVVLHAGGQGRIMLWLAGGSAWCAVTDSGPGIPARYLSNPEAPGAFEVGGRGIWLAYQLCDEVTVTTGPAGTTVGLRIALPAEGT